MVFSSTVFLVWFLPFFMAAYHFMDRKYKNYFTLAASAFFYAWGGPVFIFVIFITTFIDFRLVEWMNNSTDEKKRKKILALALSINLGMLAVFKFANFFMDSADGILHSMGFENLGWTRIILPIGISFYTFESITYIVDVYRKIHPPLKKFSDYQLYILYFPKLLAGPIVRYHEIGDQINGRFDTFTQAQFLNGFYRFVTGLSKKLLIANVLGATANLVFSQNPDHLSTSAAWLGLIAYAMQIYFDFAGYSDIAIGLGHMMGFRIPENFDNPYSSRNITEFWTRWHTSFNRWMKNYLYIPLGGNRLGTSRMYFNLFLVFFLSGLWHGATWKCVLWGLYHGFFIILHRLTGNKFFPWMPGFIWVGFTFVIVVFGCVLFHPGEFSTVPGFYSALFGGGSGVYVLSSDKEFSFTLMLALLFSFWNLIPYICRLQPKWYAELRSNSSHIAMTSICLCLYVLCLSYATWSTFNPFIYLRF